MTFCALLPWIAGIGAAAFTGLALHEWFKKRLELVSKISEDYAANFTNVNNSYFNLRTEYDDYQNKVEQKLNDYDDLHARYNQLLTKSDTSELQTVEQDDKFAALEAKYQALQIEFDNYKQHKPVNVAVPNPVATPPADILPGEVKKVAEQLKDAPLDLGKEVDKAMVVSLEEENVVLEETKPPINRLSKRRSKKRRKTRT